VADFPVPTVPLAVQEHFAALVVRHERVRGVQLEALRQASYFFQTLLHRAFSDTDSTNNQQRNPNGSAMSRVGVLAG